VTCSCYDFRRRQIACKHVIAYKLDRLARPAPMPASVLNDGLEQMASARGHVLRMVRHDDGEISWERDRQLSDRYAEIFKKFEGD
jgi:hypothetical protein